MQIVAPPETKEILNSRVNALAGLSLSQCAMICDLNVPEVQKKQKGWIGSMLEKALGADATCLPEPDFTLLGIELKTLPIGNNGKPCESTFVTSISLHHIQDETWLTSRVKKKLSHVLWLPVEDNPAIPLGERRIGQGFFWQPSAAQDDILKRDWGELTELIVLGQFESISAKLGMALQIRPKAASGKSLSRAFDANGHSTQTLPRGFYLRASFTASLLNSY